MTMKELRSMTLQGLKCCLAGPDPNRQLTRDALTVLAASLPAQAVRHAVCNADKPDCVTDEQFEAVMNNVCIALIKLETEYGTLIGTEE